MRCLLPHVYRSMLVLLLRLLKLHVRRLLLLHPRVRLLPVLRIPPSRKSPIGGSRWHIYGGAHRWEPLPHRWLPPVGAVAPSVVAIGGSRRPIGGCHQWEPVAHLWWGPSVGAVAPSVVATSGNYRPIALPHHSTHPVPLSLPRIPSLRMHVINSYRSRSSALVTKNILDTGVSATSTRHWLGRRVACSSCCRWMAQRRTVGSLAGMMDEPVLSIPCVLQKKKKKKYSKSLADTFDKYVRTKEMRTTGTLWCKPSSSQASLGRTVGVGCTNSHQTNISLLV